MESGHTFKVPSTSSGYKEIVQETSRKMMDHVHNRGRKYIKIYFYIKINIIQKYLNTSVYTQY